MKHTFWYADNEICCFFFFLKIFKFLFYDMGILLAYVSVHLHVGFLQRPEEGIKSTGHRVTDSCVGNRTCDGLEEPSELCLFGFVLFFFIIYLFIFILHPNQSPPPPSPPSPALPPPFSLPHLTACPVINSKSLQETKCILSH